MKTERSDIESKVKFIVASKFGIDESQLQGDNKLVEDLGLDSLDLLTVQESLEELFDLQLPDEALPKGLTINNIVDAIAQALEAK